MAGIAKEKPSKVAYVKMAFDALGDDAGNAKIRKWCKDMHGIEVSPVVVSMVREQRSKREVGRIYEITEGKNKGQIVLDLNEQEEDPEAMFIMASVIQIAANALYTIAKGEIEAGK